MIKYTGNKLVLVTTHKNIVLPFTGEPDGYTAAARTISTVAHDAHLKHEVAQALGVQTSSINPPNLLNIIGRGILTVYGIHAGPTELARIAELL